MALEFSQLKSKKKEKKLSNDVPFIKSVSKKDVAIVGISCKIAEADNIDDYWNGLISSKDYIRKIPENRKFDMDNFMNYYKNFNSNDNYEEIAYLNYIDKFDYKFFSLSPKESSIMDPHQRLFLQEAWSAIEDGGYGGGKLKGTKTGVFVGYSNDNIIDYKTFVYSMKSELLSLATTGNMKSIIASRISYLLDLKGPAVIIDTACSSSLVAVHYAYQSLVSGKCSYAIAGGVRVNLLSVKNHLDNGIGIQSKDGRVRAFDDNAEGTGNGEGIIAVLLKPLSQAIKDKDSIYAVIKGSAINQDGETMGITSPNPEAQENVIVDSWKYAEINPETISYIETHGTGTKLGDPIEIEGIKRAFGRYTEKKQFCAIGSVKSNIGHLDSAAGMAGLLKAILALKNKKIPATLHFNMPNRKISFEDSPVFVNDRLIDWNVTDGKRRCGVSAFGLSGTNCHIVLEECLDYNKEVQKTNKKQILTLSAKSEQALKKLVDKHIVYAKKIDSELIESICYTNNTARGHYEYRLALIVKDIEDLRKNLEYIKAYSFDKLNRDNIFYGYSASIEKQKRESILDYKKELNIEGVSKVNELVNSSNNDSYEKDLKVLGELYVQGADIEWLKLYKDSQCRILNVPTYAFEDKRCWVDTKHNSAEANFIRIDQENNKGDEIFDVKIIDEHSMIQKKIAESWSKVLGVKELSIYDNFYDLGGDSILATHLVRELEAIYPKIINISNIFSYPTIKDLSECIESKLEILNKNEEIRLDDVTIKPIVRKINMLETEVSEMIKPVGIKEYYETTLVQKGLYILNRLEADSLNYNIPLIGVLYGNINIDNMKTAFNKLIERHEALRTSFDVIDGEVIQKINKNANFELVYHELDKNKENVLSYFENEFIRPFDLKKMPLFRAEIIKESEGKYYLLMDVHHIIADGQSLQIVISDLVSLYDGKELEPLKIQFKDYAVWQNKFFKTKRYREQEEYWFYMYKDGIPVMDFQTDYSRGDTQSFDGNVIKFSLGEELYNNLFKIAKEKNITMHMILFSAYSTMLAMYTNQEDLVIGVPVIGRNHKDLENVMGMFVNTLPIRSYPNGGKTFSDFLNENKNNLLNAYKHQDININTLIDKLGVKKEVNRSSIVETVFNFRGGNQSSESIDNLRYENVNFQMKISKFDFSLIAIKSKNDIDFELEYCTTLFKKSTMEAMSECYIKILKSIVENINICLNEIDTGEFECIDVEIEDIEFDF